MKIIKITKENSQLLVLKVSEIIRNNGAVILSFDTVYGYACDPKSNKALQKIFKLKERDIKKTIGLAACDTEALESIAEINEAAKKYITDRIPGKYTFIVKAKQKTGLSQYCIKDDTIGVRIPESDFMLDIIQSSGGIIAQTSANKSGQPDCFSLDELFTQYSAEELSQIDLIVDGGSLEKTGPSQIIDLTGNEPREIDRS